jgi:predicted transcriptional regulator of viral defense system
MLYVTLIMKLKDAIKQFDLMDKKLNKSIFNKKDLRIAFPGENERSLEKSISRLINDGVLERVVKGVYAYRYGSSMRGYAIENIVKAMRPLDANYVSLESALSEYGAISQVLISHITIMTTGRSGVYKTTRGTIEFTHTSRGLSTLRKRTIAVDGRPLPIATQEAALDDLKRVGRNLNMVSSEFLESRGRG